MPTNESKCGHAVLVISPIHLYMCSHKCVVNVSTKPLKINNISYKYTKIRRVGTILARLKKILEQAGVVHDIKSQ